MADLAALWAVIVTHDPVWQFVLGLRLATVGLLVAAAWNFWKKSREEAP